MKDRISMFEKFLASAAFFVAVALAFTSLIISSEHEITSGVLMACAQFLLLTASILHIDYKLGIFDRNNDKNTTGYSQ